MTIKSILQRIACIIFLLVIIIVLINIHSILSFFKDPSEILSAITIHKTLNNPANTKQYSASVQMGVVDQKLYLLRDSTLYLFNGRRFEDVEHFDGLVISVGSEYVYYKEYPPLESQIHYDDVFCYYIPDKTRTHLLRTSSFYFKDSYWDNGILYIPKNDDCTSFYPIKKNQIGDPTTKKEFYSLSDSQFTLEYQNGSKELVRYDKEHLSGQVESLPYGKKSMILCDSGLLIHNEDQGDLLYYISENTGKVTELFTVDCMSSVSSVTVYEENVYLSFLRYEKLDKWGYMTRFKNDMLEGTYRICLNDYSVEKISDEVYTGMFIFDDSGIFACNSTGQVYKLDFDGNVTMVLLE